MTNYDEIDFSPIQALTEGEVITHSRVRDITLPSGKVLVAEGVGRCVDGNWLAHRSASRTEL